MNKILVSVAKSGWYFSVRNKQACKHVCKQSHKLISSVNKKNNLSQLLKFFIAIFLWLTFALLFSLKKRWIPNLHIIFYSVELEVRNLTFLRWNSKANNS